MINSSKSSKMRLSLLAPLAMLLLASTNLYAQQPVSISLNGAAEVPPVTTAAAGAGQITVLPDHTMSGSIKTSGLAPTMAHVHEGATGKNGAPIITLTRTGDGSFAIPPDSKLTETQYSSYMAGDLYLNVHSAKHPEGEIRAQLVGKPMRLAN